MCYLTLNEVLEIYIHVMQQSGGAHGIREEGALKSTPAAENRVFYENAGLHFRICGGIE